MEVTLAEILGRLRSAETIADCLGTLVDTRLIAGTRIVGFREERHSPAIARMPRPNWWAERMGWPKGFVQEWMRRNLAAQDPAQASELFRPGALARWTLPSPPAAGADAAAARADAVSFLLRHGIREGWVAPVRRQDGRIGWVSWLAPRTRRAAPPARDLLLIAEMFFEALDRVRPRDPEGLLSPMEQRCLAWAAYGCTDKEIASAVRRSPDTVRFHMKNVLKKLGAANRTHAVALALDQGIVRLGSIPGARKKASRR